MPWLKAGDNAATHPRVTRLLTLGDERILNEVFGFVVRCTLQSAAHMTDYLVDEGTTAMLGGARTNELLRLARKVGLMKPEKVAGERFWRIVEDPEFLHMRLRSEIEWERQRKADAANPALTVPVRLRDGDACRYCTRIVNWKARRGDRRGSYDHREPGRAATVATYVVACWGCNQARSGDPKADERVPLLPAPSDPFYGDETVDLLARNGHIVQPSIPRPGNQPDTATPSDPAPSRTPRTTATPPPAGHRAQPSDPAPRRGTPPPRPGTQPDTASTTPRRSADPADPRSTDRDGTGRDGSVAPTSPGAPAAPTRPRASPVASSSPPSRRRRRGRRSHGDH